EPQNIAPTTAHRGASDRWIAGRPALPNQGRPSPCGPAQRRRRRFSVGWGMNNLDKQITAAARDPDAFAHRGFTPAWAEVLQTPADKMHALLVERPDALVGCTEGFPEEAELAKLTDAIEAYEAVRWPNGKMAGGNGG